MTKTKAATAGDAEPNTETYYGTQEETYYVASDGSIWLLQSPDMRGSQDRERVHGLPESVRPLHDVVCRDLAPTAEAIEAALRAAAE